MPDTPENGEPGDVDETGSTTSSQTESSSHDDVLQSAFDQTGMDSWSRLEAARLPIVPGEKTDAEKRAEQDAKFEDAMQRDADAARSDLPKSVVDELTPVVVLGSATPPDQTSPEGPDESGAGEGFEFQPVGDQGYIPQPWWRQSKPLKWTLFGTAAVLIGVGAVVITNGTEATDGTQAPSVVVEQDQANPVDSSGASGSVGIDTPAEDSVDATSDATKTSSAAGTTTDSVTDPLGDQYQSFDDLDPIDPSKTRDGVSGQDVLDKTDLIGMSVTVNSADATTEIALTFSGAAQEVQNASGQSLTGDVLIYQSSGRVLNVLIRNDGSVKISDIPGGMSISSRWLTLDEFVIVIFGLSLDPATQVEAYALIEAYAGFMTDLVTLVTSTP